MRDISARQKKKKRKPSPAPKIILLINEKIKNFEKINFM